MQRSWAWVLAGGLTLFSPLGPPTTYGGPRNNAVQPEDLDDTPRRDWADAIVENREQIAWIGVALVACLVVGIMGFKVLSTADAVNAKTARRLRPPNEGGDQIF